MMNDVLGYIRKSLSLCAPIRLYERTLDRPNITYVVAELRKPDFQEFADLIPLEPNCAAIPKTMIFVDKSATEQLWSSS